MDVIRIKFTLRQVSTLKTEKKTMLCSFGFQTRNIVLPINGIACRIAANKIRGKTESFMRFI